MAAGILPKPGSKTGPCSEPCQHRDCAATRKEAALLCKHCEKPIGYDTRFYKVGDDNGGYRIAGPKYSGNSKQLQKHVIDSHDAQQIRKYLDAAFPPEARL